LMVSEDIQFLVAAITKNHTTKATIGNSNTHKF